MDSLSGLAGLKVLRAEIYWQEVPNIDFFFSRRILEYLGTSQQVIEISSYKPLSFKGSTVNKNKIEEYELLDNWAQFKGRLTRFWVMCPLQFFSLKQEINFGADTITVYNNNFSENYKGYGRLYIRLRNNDLITRKIEDVIVTAEEQIIQVDLAFDRNIKEEDIICFSLLLLVRFDIDELELDYKNPQVSTANLRVVELVKEYQEL